MTESRSGWSSSASARATSSTTVVGRNAPASSWASVVKRASNSGAGRGVAALEGGLGMILANVRGRLRARSEEHTSELQSRLHLVCRLLLEKKKKNKIIDTYTSRISCYRSLPRTRRQRLRD